MLENFYKQKFHLAVNHGSHLDTNITYALNLTFEKLVHSNNFLQKFGFSQGEGVLVFRISSRSYHKFKKMLWKVLLKTWYTVFKVNIKI